MTRKVLRKRAIKKPNIQPNRIKRIKERIRTKLA